MKKSFQAIGLLVLSVFLMVSCSTDNQDSDLLPDQELSFSIDQDVSILPDNGNALSELTNRNPNSNQTDEELIRGTRVTIPLFDESPVEIRVGRWATVTFSIQINDADPALCDGPVSDEQVATILDDAITFLENNSVEVTFNGEILDITENFRTEGLAVTEINGVCTYNLPWRYYQNPRPRGDYELVFTINGVSYSRTVSWVRK